MRGVIIVESCYEGLILDNPSSLRGHGLVSDTLSDNEGPSSLRGSLVAMKQITNSINCMKSQRKSAIRHAFTIVIMRNIVEIEAN